MAIFQYKIEAIPIEFAKKYEGDISHALEKFFAWENVSNPSISYIEALRILLPIESSWGDTEEYKSDKEWGSQLQIFKSAQKVEGILLKYSPGSDSLDILQKFVELAYVEQCVLYAVESKRIFEADFEIIFEDLKNSKAMKFLENPEKTIIESANEIEAIGIGRRLTAPPSHTTQHTGPYCAVRLIRQDQVQGNESPNEVK